MAEDEKINKIGQIEEKTSIEQGDNSAQIFDDENINADTFEFATVKVADIANNNQNIEADIVVIDKEEIKEQTEFDISRGLEVSEEYTEQKYQKVMEYQSPKKRRKSTIINLCLLLINLIFLVTIVKSLIRNVGEKNILDVVSSQGDKMWWLAGGLLIYVLFMLVQV